MIKNMDINPEDKADLRIKMRELRNGMDEEKRLEKSHQVFKRLIKSPVYKNAKSIFCYVSFRNEVDTWQLLKECLMDEKRLMVPKVVGKTEMQFFEIKNLKELEPGYMGIYEPAETCPLVIPKDREEYAAMIVPGLAFDRRGHRLGYGGGFYDRYMSAFPWLVKVATAYDCQLLERVPLEVFDERVDIIVTESFLIGM